MLKSLSDPRRAGMILFSLGACLLSLASARSAPRVLPAGAEFMDQQEALLSWVVFEGNAATLQSESFEGASPSTLLRLGLYYVHKQRWKEGVEPLRSALNSGYLSPMGQTLAYWGLHGCYSGSGRPHEALNALHGFVSSAPLALGHGQEKDELEDENVHAFAEAFALKRRLAQARALLLAAWQARHTEVGRSPRSPLLLEEMEDMRYFLSYAQVCGQDTPVTEVIRHSEQEQIPALGSKPAGVERIEVVCGNAQGSRPLFIEAARGGLLSYER